MINNSDKSKPIQCLVRAMKMLQIIAASDARSLPPDANRQQQSLITESGQSDPPAAGACGVAGGEAIEVAGGVAGAGVAGVGVSELAAKMALHVATTHNILRTLVSGGFLINISGRYHMGPAAVKLAESYSPMSLLPRLTEPPMREMSEQCGETGFLAFLRSGVCHMRPISQGSSEIAVQPRDRSFDNPLAVASGRLLVACGDTQLWDQYITRHIEAGHAVSHELMTEELEHVRRWGCCILRRPRPDGVDAIATVLRSTDEHICAALGVNCPAFRGNAAHYKLMLSCLAEAAASASASLGVRQSTVSESVIDSVIARSFSESKASVNA